MDKGRLHDEIERVAYELYEGRGKVEGCHHDDWFEAERIVLQRHAGAEAKTEGGKRGAISAVRKIAALGQPKEKGARPLLKTSAAKEKKVTGRKKK